MSQYTYEGSELELFKDATNWKSYFARQLAPYIRGDVVEVGAGIGATTACLLSAGEAPKSWVCLEPDEALLRQVPLADLRALRPGCAVETRHGVLANLPAEPAYDTILYIDVLEHIERDAEELLHAHKRLRPGGSIVILAPAHNSLMSPFDRAIGHFRRYNLRELQAVVPPECRIAAAGYLDSVGYFASLTNALVLKKSSPSKKDIAFWDKVLVPASKITDVLLRQRFGKTVYLIAQK